MNLPMLAVDSNIEVSEREQAAWKDQGVTTVRVSSMQEAIEKLSKEKFFIVVINADSINFLPLLRVMRDITHLLIYIITTNYSTKEHKEVLDNGADAYVAFSGNAAENVQMAMALVNRHIERDMMPKKLTSMITYQGLFFYPKWRKVFFRDVEIDLTKTEYDIFNLLITHPNQPLPPSTIYRKVWGKEYEEAAQQDLWQHISRLRKKFKAANHDGCIVSRRGMGYCFSTRPKD